MRRETAWIFITPVQTTLAGASTAVLSNALNAALSALRPFTVVRARGTFHLQSDQAAQDEFYQALIGLCVVSD